MTLKAIPPETKLKVKRLNMKTIHAVESGPVPCESFTIERPIEVVEAMNLCSILGTDEEDLDIRGVHGEKLGSIEHGGYYCDQEEKVMIEPTKIYFDPSLRLKLQAFLATRP